MSEKKKLNTADEVLKSLSARSDKQEKLKPKKEEPKLMTAAEFINSNAKLKDHIPSEVLDKSAVSLYGTPIYTPLGDELVKYNVPFTPGEVNPYIAGKLVEEYQDDKWSIGAKNFAKGAASGVLYGIGSWDLTDHTGLIAGKHQEYGNWFTKKAQELGESMEQIHYNEDTVWSSGYFANMLGQTGLTVGLMALSMGEGFAAGLLAPETAGASVLGYIAKLGRMGKMTASMLKNVKKAALVGTLYGIKETHTNAIETYEGIIQQYTGEINPKTGKTFTNKEVVDMASIAASNGYATELATVTTLNALQFAAIGAFNPFAAKGVNLGISGAAEGLLTKALPKGTSPWLKAGFGSIFNAASEGVEEGVQTYIGKKGHLAAEKAYGFNKKKTMYDVVTEDYEMRDAIFQGMVSGGLLGLGGRGLTSGKKFLTRRRRKAQSDALLAQSVRNKAHHLHMLQEALQTGNKGYITKVRKDANTSNTEELLIHDRVNMNETSFNNYITVLADTQKLAAEALEGDANAIEELRKKDIITEEDLKYIAGSYNDRIQEAISFKEDLTKEMQSHGSFKAALETASNLSYFSNLEDATKTEVAKNRVAKEGDTVYNGLSAAGRTKFNAEVKARAAAKVGDTETMIEQNKKAAALEYTKTDKKAVKSISKDAYILHEQEMLALEEQKQAHLDEIAKWRDVEYIKEQEKESRERQARKVVSDAETKEDAVEAVQEIIDENNVSPEEANKLKGNIQKDIIASKTDKTTTPPTQAIKDIANGMDFSSASADRAEDAKAAAEFSVEEAIEAPSIESTDNAEEDDGRGDINEPQLSRNFKAVGKHNALFEAYKKEEEAKKGRKITFEEYFKGLKNGLENMGIKDTQLYYDSAAQWWKKEYDAKLNIEDTHNKFYTSSAMTGLAAISEELNKEAHNTESTNKAPVQDKKEYKVIPEEEKTLKDKTKVPDLGKKAAIKTVPFTYSFKDGQLFLQSVEGTDAISLPNRATQNLMLDGAVFNKNTQFDIKIAENLDLSSVNIFMPLDRLEKEYTIDKSSSNYQAAYKANPKGMVSTDMFGLNITFKGYLGANHPEYAKELEKGNDSFIEYLKANPNDDILGYLPLESWLDGKILGVGVHATQWYYEDRYSGQDYTAEQKANIVARSKATVVNYRKQILSGNTKFKVSNLEKFAVSETHPKGTYPKLNTIPNSRVILVKDDDEGKRRYYYVTDNKTTLKKHVTIPVITRDMEAEDGSGRRIPVINSERHAGKNYKAEGRIETDENGNEILVIVKLITKATDVKTHLLATNKNVSRTADLIDRFALNPESLSEAELAAVKDLSVKLKGRTYPSGPKSSEDTRFIDSKGKLIDEKLVNLRAMYGYEKVGTSKRTLIAPYLNTSQENLWVINENFKVVNYKEGVSVKNDEGKETNSYTKYLKDSLGSNVKSFSYINNKGETKHTAFPQPAIGISMVDEVADVKREEVKPEEKEAVKSAEDMLDEANDEAARGRDMFGIPEEGYIRQDITELLTLAELKESKEFQGLVINFVDHIVKERDKPVYLTTNVKDKVITMSEEGIKKLYKDKAWTKSATQRDGSKSTPIAKNRFKSFDEFLTFIILHEKAHHYIFIEEGEEYGSYEDRINAEAFRILDSMGELADITKEEVFEEDGETLSESNKREIGSYLFHMTARNLDLTQKINKEGHIRDAFDKAFRKFVLTHRGSKYIKEIKAKKESFIDLGEAYSVGAQFIDFFGTNIENLGPEVSSNQVEKNHFKDNAQLDVMLSLSQEVKLFFAGISRGKTGFLGQPIYGNIAQSIVEIRDLWTNGSSNVEDLIKILEKKSLSSGFEYLSEFALRMRKADTKTVNSMAHNLVKTPMNMYYLSYGTGTNGAYTKLQQANSKSPNVRIRQQWGEAAKITGLMEASDFNAKLKTQLTKEYNRFKKTDVDKLTDKELSNYLKYFGISLHTRTLANIRNTGKMLETMIQSGIFKELNGALLKPYDKSKQILKSDFVKKPLRNLVQLEIESTFNPSVTNYVGGKLVQPYRDNNLLNTLLEKLKDPEYVAAIQADRYKSYSYMLDRILRGAENEEVKQAIQVFFNSLDALKDSDNNKSTGADITKQSDVENHLTFLGSFMSLIPDQGIDSNIDTKYGLKFRKRAIPLMVLADSGAYPSVITEVLDLKQSDIIGEISDDVLEFLYTQTVAGEIFRTQGPDINVKGQKDYKNVIFQLLKANTIELKNGLLLYDYLAGHNGVKMEIIENLPIKGEGTVKDAIKELLRNSVEAEVAAMRKEITPDLLKRLQDKVYFTTKEGLVSEDQRMEFLLKDYIINYRTVNANMKQLLFQDDVFYAKGKIEDINTAEVNENVEPMVANIEERFEAIAKKTKTNANKRYKAFISPLKLLANTQQNKVQYFKGYANDRFIQFAMRDEIAHSQVLIDLIQYSHGVKLTKNLRAFIDAYSNFTKDEKYLAREEISEDFIKDIKTKYKLKLTKTDVTKLEGGLALAFPKIKDYLKIENTDAQEYITWREHLFNLVGKGELSEIEGRRLERKFKSQEKEGVTDKNRLTEEEKKVVVFQPIKSLYAGVKTENGVVYPIYIKSSAFPLLPEITAGKGLEALRLKLKKAESKRHGNDKLLARASYSTANKVGEDSENLYYLEEMYDADMDNVGRVLSREYYGIQQENPYKTDKFNDKGKDNEINVASQPAKVLFSNGIARSDKKAYDAKTFSSSLIIDALGEMPKDGKLSGKELFKVWEKAHEGLDNIAAEEAREELGLDEHFNPVDSLATFKKIRKLLEKEAIARTLPQSDVDALGIYYRVRNKETNQVETVKELDERKHELFKEDAIGFASPLWLSSSSDVFEALVNSLITNRFLKAKLPGDAFILGSNQGFELTDEASVNTDNVVYINERKPGQKLKATYSKDGKMIGAEALIPSKFKKINSEGETVLIDLTEEPYSVRINGRLYLQTEDNKALIENAGLTFTNMIDQELLKSFSFRIPTSSLQSGAIITVVGFLPQSSRDLMVTASDYITQIGEDFDIDKRQVYRKNYVLDDNSKITLLNEDYFEKRGGIAAFQKELNEKHPIWAARETEHLLEFQKQNVFTNVDEESKGEEVLAAVRRYRAYQDYKAKADNFRLSSADHVRMKELVEFIKDNQELANKAEAFLIAQDASEAKMKDLIASRKLFADKVALETKGKYYEKLLQNDMVNIYQSVYSNPDNQKFINKTLSTDVTEATVAYIDAKSPSVNWPSNSYMAQHELGKANADGAIGISVYSKLVTLNAQLQQLAAPIQMLDGFSLGGVKMSGKIGLATESVSDKLGEAQNVALDNAKLQLMLSRNDNSITMPVYGLLHMLGLGNMVINNTEIDIASLFMAQPIIIEYVNRSKDAKAIFSEYTNVIEELKDKYIGKKDVKELSDAHGRTREGILESIGKNINDMSQIQKETQFTLLSLFLELKETSNVLTEASQLIDVATSDFGKSYHKVVDMGNELSKNSPLGVLTPLLNNVFGKKLRRATLFGNNAFNDIFPYGSEFLQAKLDIGYKGKFEDNIERKRSIMNGIRDAVYSNEKLGIYGKDISVKRHELFSRVDNEPLAEFILKLQQDERHIIGRFPILQALSASVLEDHSVIKINGNKEKNSLTNNVEYEDFLALYNSDITFETLRNGKPYTGKQLAEDLAALAYLGKTENGVTDIRRFIHRDFLEEKGFGDYLRYVDFTHKDKVNMYTPLLDSFYTELRRNIGDLKLVDGVRVFNENTNKNYINILVKSVNKKAGRTLIYRTANGIIIPGDTERAIGKFEKEYFQHNPDKVPTHIKYLSEEYKNENGIEEYEVEPGVWVYRVEYTPKDPDKDDWSAFTDNDYFTKMVEGEVALFEKYIENETHSLYRKIPLKGAYGVNEYNANTRHSSIIPENNKESKAYVPIILPKLKYKNNLKFDNANAKEALVYLSKSGVHAGLAQTLLPFVSEDTKVVIVESTKFHGRYVPKTDTIEISSRMLKDAKGMTDALLEEITHSVIAKDLDKYINLNTVTEDGKLDIFRPGFNIGNVPDSVKKLVWMYSYYAHEIGLDRIGEFVRTKGNNNPGALTFNSEVFENDEASQMIYRASQLQEFVGGMMGNSMFREKMGQKKYKKSNHTMVSQFFNNLKLLLKDIFSKFVKNSVAEHSIDAIIEFLEDTKIEKVKKGLKGGISYEDMVNSETLAESKRIDEATAKVMGVDNIEGTLPELESPNFKRRLPDCIK